ncbi:MAG: hypothetical protein ACTHN0_04405, partial [Aquihabitans sp.]
MAPPRDLDTASAGGLCPEAEYEAIIDEIAANQGVINAAEARTVELTARALELGVSGGTNLSPEQWLEWQTGVTPGRAKGIVRLARRRDELPAT